MSLIATDAPANCWKLPFEGSGVQTAEVVKDQGHVAVGLPEIGRAFVVSVDLSQALELRPPPSDAFADGAGFGTSVALDGDIVAVGAVRIGDHGSGVEQPARVFHSGAVYTFDVSSGALRWRAVSDAERVFGHSLSIKENMVAYGVYEAPGSDGGSVRLRSAAQGAVAFRSRDGAPLHVIDGPADARGFGAELSGRGPMITTAASEDTRGIWALRDETAIRLGSMPATLNGIPATHVAASGSTVAVSAGGGFDGAAGRTRLLVPGSQTYEITAGGPVALSEDRLSVLVYAAPEGPEHNRLFVYRILRNSTPVEVAAIDHVIGADLDHENAFAVLAEPGAPLRLCKIAT